MSAQNRVYEKTSSKMHYKITASVDRNNVFKSSCWKTLFNTLTMFSVSLMSGYVSLSVLTALIPAISANSSQPAPTQASNCCHNIYNYNGCSGGPDKEIKTLLPEMNAKLAEFQKTCQASCKGKSRHFVQFFWSDTIERADQTSCRRKKGNNWTPGNKTVKLSAKTRHIEVFV